MKIELHLLQNFAPSCLNRDDTNTPKDCEFGGVRRARISSQCLKRSIRKHIEQTGSVQIGTRTKRLKQKLTKMLTEEPEIGKSEYFSDGLDLFIEAYYSKPDKKQPDLTAVLLFLGQPEIDLVADLIREQWATTILPVAQKRAQAKAKQATEKKTEAEDEEGEEQAEEAPAQPSGKKKKELPSLQRDKLTAEKIKAAILSPDIALFGRMLAEQADMNTDGSCQVAHALSTHRAEIDMDFFSAVDDLNERGQTGAGMLGVTGFSSACFYRYALIDLPTLTKNLKEDKLQALRTVKAFLEAAIEAIPTGKQNSMAAHNKPDFGFFVVRDSGAPCSLANAFAKPISIDSGIDEDLIGLSVQALNNHWDLLTQVYGGDGIKSISLFTLGHKGRLGEKLTKADQGSVKAAIDAAMTALDSNNLLASQEAA